ncbi:methyl-accepting chemotaxis protein [Oceanirhabdus sp. W0125-5]|uniref:methyl-accepting chemotaxis protein n=1 Tax=Oceanirhabdus sp. W0125-5 TaxID=2999116 RepID=UPI0022F2DC50|nr:methyl-accepting chemotaxis protein [Oceanirhabdus sp. W0125-5]WBW97841.1 methyl-accepting chemotaxis protein [Oceanirhabdus sp. W0125-5]
MIKFKKLSRKLLVLIGLAVILTFSTTIGFILIQFENTVMDKAINEEREMANRYSLYVRAELEVAMDAARTLAQTAKGIRNSGNPDRVMLNNIMKQILEDNSNFLTVWNMWEPNAFDGKDEEYANRKAEGYDKTGRLATYWYRKEGKTIVDYNDDYKANYYILPKNNKQETILNPYKDVIDVKEILMTSVIVPVMEGDKVLGVIGIDISLESLQDMIKELKFYGNGYATLISNEGIIVAHKEDKYIDKPIDERTDDDMGIKEEMIKAKTAIKSGKPYETVIASEVINEEVFSMYSPISIGKSQTPWSVAVNIPTDVILKEANKVRNYAIFMSGVSLIIILLILFFIIRGTVKPIKGTINMLKDIAEGEGDLTKRLKSDSQDEIGELVKWFNLFIDKIQELIGQVQENANTVAHSTNEMTTVIDHANIGMEQISNDVNSVSSSIQNNAGIITEITSSVEDMAITSESISNSSQAVFSDSKMVLDSANIGMRNMNEVVEVNDKAKNSSDEVYGIIKALQDSSERVGEIVEIITGISDQTNLLALNASIEAARAAEHGAGFAVVANEVKNLAEQSKQATSRISALIEEIQNKTSIADLAITKGQEYAQISAHKSKDTEDQFKKILKLIEDITGKLEGISESSVQQSTVSEELRQAMEEISESTQNSANSISKINSILEEEVSSFEEIGASTMDLNNMTRDLKEKTDMFKID